MTGLWLAASDPAVTSALPAATGPTTLTWGQTMAALLIMGAVLLLSGLVVILARQGGKTGNERTVVRSWIAISLVIGLLLFCALTFAVNDETLRSTLIGGLTASVGSAIAYYFSTKSAEQSRQDLVNAIAGGEIVPDLHGMDQEKAAATLGKTFLKLEIDPTGSQDPTATATAQHPDRGVSAPKGSSVQVTLARPPTPPLAPTPIPIPPLTR